METVVHLDTHVVAWLFAGDIGRLKPVQRLLQSHALVISPVVVLELQYLFEIKRVALPGSEVVRDLVARIGLAVSNLSFSRIVEAALQQAWTRDPFDRLIVGNALAEELVPLVTKDAVILKHCPLGVWGPGRGRSRR